MEGGGGEGGEERALISSSLPYLCIYIFTDRDILFISFHKL